MLPCTLAVIGMLRSATLIIWTGSSYLQLMVTGSASEWLSSPLS